MLVFYLIACIYPFFISFWGGLKATVILTEHLKEVNIEGEENKVFIKKFMERVSQMGHLTGKLGGVIRVEHSITS